MDFVLEFFNNSLRGSLSNKSVVNLFWFDVFHFPNPDPGFVLLIIIS